MQQPQGRPGRDLRRAAARGERAARGRVQAAGRPGQGGPGARAAGGRPGPGPAAGRAARRSPRPRWPGPQGQIDDTLASIVGQPQADRPDRPLVLPGRRHGRARGRAAVAEPGRVRDPAGPRAERDALGGQRAQRPGREPGQPGRPAGHPGRQARAGRRDEAPAGGAGREDQRPAGAGDRRAARRSSR